MKFEHLTALIPCRALEDLSLERNADEAEQLLSAWTALWHPALVADARTMPRWASAESPPEEVSAGYLIVLPPCCEHLLPADWLAKAEAAGARVLRDLRHRPEMVAAALEQLGPEAPPVDAELAADFLALGFCHFTIEMLTQHLRYMNNLDEAGFERELVAAAEATCRGDLEAARTGLQAAFDLLHNAREYFYPVEAHLLDLTLLASTTIGPSLRGELAGSLPVNLLASAEVVAEMAAREPASLEAMRKALEAGTAALVGGEFKELELPLLGPEAIRHQLSKGAEVYQRHLGIRPTVFARRRFGLTPVLPQILDKLGFVGVLHATLDEGRFPADNQSRIRWEGIDSTVVETLCRVPSDIGRADAFLNLAQRLGNSMDLDHVSTIIFAHWPSRSSTWYQDVRRIVRYTSVLGTFESITHYFEQTGMAGQQTAYKADQYRSPYLRQAVAAGQADPISRWVRYYERRAMAEADQTLSTLADLAACGAVAGGGMMSAVDDSLGGEEPAAALDEQLQRNLAAAVARFSGSIAGTQLAPGQAVLLANPCSFSRRLCLELPELSSLPEVAEPVCQAGEVAGRRTVVVDVPPLGFAWVRPGMVAAQPEKPLPRKWGIFKRPPPEEPAMVERRASKMPARRDLRVRAAEEIALHNEFFEAIIDLKTGGIRALLDFASRGPRLAQQLALRLPGAGGDDDEAYSTMAADEVTITTAGPVLGEVVARGKLTDRGGRRLAGFRQTTRVWRGSRVVEILIDLDVDQLPGPEPWSSYYAARFAWSDDTANLYRGVNMANLPTDVPQLEAPHFIDIRSGKLRTSILTAGLPYHRRIGLRRLDSLLIVRGETARHFRLGIGIDAPHPMAVALDFLTPPTMRAGLLPSALASGWMFHLDTRAVVATYWEPIGDPVAGFRVRLLETDGRAVTLGLRSFRVLKSAQKVGHAKQPPVDLPVEGDRVAVAMGPHEWAEVEARFG